MNSKRRDQEANELRDKSLLILHFLKRTTGDAPHWNQMEEVIDREFRGGRVRALRIVHRELVDWSKDLPIDQRDRLSAMLEAGNSDVDGAPPPERFEGESRVQKVLQRQRIVNAREYQAVLTRLDKLDTEKADAAERMDLLRCVRAYEREF